MFRTLALPYTEPWLGIGALTVQNARRSDCGTRSAGGGGCRPPRKRDARVRFALRKMLVCACRVWRKTRGATPAFFSATFFCQRLSRLKLHFRVRVCEILTFWKKKTLSEGSIALSSAGRCGTELRNIFEHYMKFSKPTAGFGQGFQTLVSAFIVRGIFCPFNS